VKIALEFALVYPGVVLTLVSFIGCLVRWQIAPADRQRTEWMIVLVLLSTIVTWIAQIGLTLMSPLLTWKLDLYFYAGDALFHHPSFVIGRFVYRHYWLEVLLQIAYTCLPTITAATIALHFYKYRSELRRVLTAFALNLCVAPIVYCLVPVCGPVYAFPSFPNDPGRVHPYFVHINNAPPNGFPSVHFSSALLILWALRRSRTTMAFGIIYAILVFAATLANGQHYLVDLFASVPYTALMVYWADRATSSSVAVELAYETRQA